MTIQLCSNTPAEEKAWDTYVYQSSQTGHYHLIGWRRIIQQVYGHQSLYLWAQDNGKVEGILPLIVIRSPLFGRSLVSMPFLDEGGICADDPHISRELYQEAYRLFQEQRVDFLDLRHRQPNTLDLPVHAMKVTLVLELEHDPDRMWKRFNAKLRNQIRKAIKSNLTVSWHDQKGVADFYEVFATNMRDLGSPVHSQRFFTAVLEEFPENARLLLVHQGNQTIGGGVCLFFKDTILVPWASSLREYFALCPNNLLYWEAIRWGCEKGYRRFDFGRSSPGSGTYHFKKQWGTFEEPLHWQYLSRKNQQISLVSADDARYRWIIRLWQRLPLGLTKQLGPFLRRQMTN